MSSQQSPIDLTTQIEAFESCAICLEDISKSKASIDSCLHSYHYNCIKVWSSVKNNCPLCQKRFYKITPPNKKSMPVKYTNRLLSDINMQRFLAEIRCQKCKEGDNESQLLLCDSCDKGFHIYCLSPALDEIPAGDWFCKRCTKKREKAQKQRSLRNQRRANRPLTRSRRRALNPPQVPIIIPHEDDDFDYSEGSPDTYYENFFAWRNRIYGSFPRPNILAYFSHEPNRNNIRSTGSNNMAGVRSGAPNRIVLNQEMRDKIELNHFKAVCRLQRNRIRRMFNGRLANIRLPPIPGEGSRAGSGGPQLTLQQQIRIQKNWLNALELRIQRLRRSAANPQTN